VGSTGIQLERTNSRADLVAWVKKGTKESVGIIQDFVDPDLTEFVYELVDTYREYIAQIRGLSRRHQVERGQAKLTIQSTLAPSRLNARTPAQTTPASAKPDTRALSRESAAA
jgi:hypothetical protein